MKTMKIAIAAGVMILILSSCVQTKQAEGVRTDAADDTADETGAGFDEVWESTPMIEPSAADETGEGFDEDNDSDSDDDQDPNQDELENLVGEYDYTSDGGTGRLIIQKTSDGYDISDYESANSYRFLADSSNIETLENNKLYIKYPKQVFADGTVEFCYYILEYRADEINVYYGKNGFDGAQFLYCATKRKEGEIVDVDEAAINQQESNVQADENMASEMTAEELFDLFINGSISAVDSTDLTSTFFITDLNMDSEEWDSYSVGERVDLDNDGENELILCGPYGGRYLDARDNKVYEFARGDGTGLMLSYVVYNGATWIMYSNRMHAGYELFYMEKYEGADHLAAEMNFSEELIDESDIESGMKYTLNGTEISYEEFEELAGRICAAEVSTN